jgi:hypothetical protein
MARLLQASTGLAAVPATALRINRAHPAARGLVFAALVQPNVAPLDLISRRFATRSDSGATSPRTAGATRTRLDGNAVTQINGYWQWGAETGFDAITTGAAFFVGGAVNSNVCVLGSGENSNGHGVEFYVDNNSWVNHGYYVAGNNTLWQNSGFNVVPSIFAIEAIAFNWQGTTLDFFANGKLAVTRSGSGWSATANSNRRTRLASRGTSATASTSTLISMALAWGRPITLPEYRLLWTDPYAILAG